MRTIFYVTLFMSLSACSLCAKDEMKLSYQVETKQNIYLEKGDHGGGNAAPPPQIANLSPEQQALLQNEAYKNPAAIMPLEKDFIINLKSPDPENMRGAGFAKFRVTLLLADKNAVKEVDAKLDIVRGVIADATSAYLATELQGSQGRQKLAGAIVASLNSVLTDGKVAAVVFPDFIIQP